MKTRSNSSASDVLKPPRIQTYQLQDDGAIPNNPRLPLIVYAGAFNANEPGAVDRIEELLEVNRWGGSWRNGIYPYHHYHSTAHEVLVVFSGSAKVQLGGERGVIETLHAGDVVIIPAGVGHKRLESSGDFAVIGAYPAGQDWDLCYGKPGERPQADRNISEVPLPEKDPLYGPGGPLLDHWAK